MAVETSSSMEEYLENIYVLQETKGLAKTKELAAKMHVSLGTITNTVEMLERQGLVTHKPYKGVRLTERGRRIALDVKRRHRLVERLLTDILHMDWSRVHEAACKLEHGLTEEVMKPLGKILGHPKTCPHGNPIPTRCGGIIEEKSQCLVNLKPQERGTIAKIVEENQDLLDHLRSLGLVVGACVKVKKRIQFNGSIVLNLGDAQRQVSSDIASVIWIRKE
jgi:DtxR family Mn-dependent transcriptional regulator